MTVYRLMERRKSDTGPRCHDCGAPAIREAADPATGARLGFYLCEFGARAAGNASLPLLRTSTAGEGSFPSPSPAADARLTRHPGVDTPGVRSIAAGRSE